MLTIATEIRHEIDSLLDIVQEKDEFFLKSVRSLLKTYVEEFKDPILGYEMDGTPITVSAFLKEADASMEEVAKGEYITIEELDKQSKEWPTPHTTSQIPSLPLLRHKAWERLE